MRTMKNQHIRNVTALSHDVRIWVLSVIHAFCILSIFVSNCAAATPMPNLGSFELVQYPASLEGSLRSYNVDPNTIIRIDFTNSYSFPITIYWLNYAGG